MTKYVNELYAHVFALNYGIETIGLRYFNVYGRRQDPNGAYAAVIPKFIMLLMTHQSPIINGDGTISRDFTYIDNVILMNHLAGTTTNHDAINQIFNVAVGERNDLNQLATLLKEYLAKFDIKIANVEIKYGPGRKGDIPQSLASVGKARTMLKYNPAFNFQNGLKLAVEWYWKNFKY